MFNVNFKELSQKSQSNGYLLLESLITLFIISCMSLYISIWCIDIFMYQREIILRDRAINMAASVVDYIKVHKNLDNFNNLPDYKLFKVKYDLKKISPNFNFVHVHVSWDSKRKTASSVTLTGGFA
ncbi:hypothetical protein M1446_01115 [Candidatus Dependentiae bacterium]|nr:hypothetical protein [Candidatus Dependentiae bacterium]